VNLKKQLAAGIISLALPLVGWAHNHGNLDMQHSWIKQPVPGTMMTGGFITITNNGMDDEQLLSASSNIAKHTELHTMVMVDGVMKMREVEAGWVIPPGETLTLKSGGNHIMFIGLSSMLMEGDKQTITLQFKHAGEVERMFMVHKPETAEMHSEAGHNHDHDNH